MKARLKIKNFGPIIDLDIEISKFNILIGSQGAGKSTISKVLCVIQSFDFNLFSEAGANRRKELFVQLLAYYRIENFFEQNTYWHFENGLFSFELNGENIKIDHKESLAKTAGQTESYYFPAERIALPMISDSLFELTHAQSTLPGYFLQFGRDFTIARKNQKLFNIPILGVEFEYKEGRNFVILRDNKTLLLEETSSAIQANLPLLIVMSYPIKRASLFVIEELELHGFPTLQKDLLYYTVARMRHENLKDAYVMLPTHSPYILSAANNLLFAAKVAKQNNESARAVADIIDEDSWINNDEFSAFYIVDGKATSIVNEKTGLIDENELDGISENLAGEFDELMDLYKPVVA